jgi:hypothetical protein
MRKKVSQWKGRLLWLGAQGSLCRLCSLTPPTGTQEGLADYRYFPEPDLPPLIISEDMIEAIKV